MDNNTMLGFLIGLLAGGGIMAAGLIIWACKDTSNEEA
jgi:hypothetical protein